LKKRYAVLGLLTALSAITFLDRICIAVAGPAMQDELGIAPDRWGWILGAFILSYSIFQVPIGALADRIGGRKVLAGIVIWWSAFTSLTGAASGFVTLLATRFLFGVGEAGAYPGMSWTVARWFPALERARAQGFIWAASRAGGAISPLLVVPLQAAFGWRAVFVLLGVVGVAWSAYWLWRHRDNPAERPGITEAELAEIGPVNELGTAARVPWNRYVRDRQFWLILGMYWCYVWGSWFYYSWLPTYMVKGRGFTTREMGIFAALPFVLGMFSNIAGGFLSDHLSSKYGLHIGRRLLGSLSLAGSALLLAAAALVAGKVSNVILLSLSFGVMDVMLPCAWAVCLDVGARHAGALTGAMNTAGNLGGFICTVLFGYLVKAFGSYDAPLLVIATLLMISAVCFSRIDSTRLLGEGVPAGTVPAATG
jgi:MFS transporter, ACS family, glucarate transporter